MALRLYIDEVGNHDWKNSDDPNNRYLSLTGVLLSLDHVKDVIHPEMEAIKNEFFRNHPDAPIILHRKDIMNADPPFHPLQNTETREAFNAAILTALSKWRYRVFTVCLDKQKHKEGYVHKWHPYHYCFEVLVERYVWYLYNKGLRGDVMIEARYKQADRALEACYTDLFDKGTGYIPVERMQRVLTSRQVKVKPKSANIVGLQLADLIAHPSRNEILSSYNQGVRLSQFGAEVSKILANKYDQYAGKVYGRKFIQK